MPRGSGRGGRSGSSSKLLVDVKTTNDGADDGDGDDDGRRNIAGPLAPVRLEEEKPRASHVSCRADATLRVAEGYSTVCGYFFLKEKEEKKKHENMPLLTLAENFQLGQKNIVVVVSCVAVFFLFRFLLLQQRFCAYLDCRSRRKGSKRRRHLFFCFSAAGTTKKKELNVDNEKKKCRFAGSLFLRPHRARQSKKKTFSDSPAHAGVGVSQVSVSLI